MRFQTVVFGLAVVAGSLMPSFVRIALAQDWPVICEFDGTGGAGQVEAAIFSGDGSSIAVIVNNRDNLKAKLSVFDARTGKLLFGVGADQTDAGVKIDTSSARGLPHAIFDLSNDGKRLLHRQYVAKPGGDGEWVHQLIVTDVASGKTVWRHQVESNKWQDVILGRLSPDGAVVVTTTAGADGKPHVQKWTITDGKSVELPGKNRLTALPGSHPISENGHAVLVDAMAGPQVVTDMTPGPILSFLVNGRLDPRGMTLSPDGTVRFLQGPGTLVTFAPGTKTRAPAVELAEPISDQALFNLSLDGQFIYCAGFAQDKTTARVINCASGKTAKTFVIERDDDMPIAVGPSGAVALINRRGPMRTIMRTIKIVQLSAD